MANAGNQILNLLAITSAAAGLAAIAAAAAAPT